MPTVCGFAESFFTGARQRRSLSSVREKHARQRNTFGKKIEEHSAKNTLGKEIEKHSAKKYARQRNRKTLGKELERPSSITRLRWNCNGRPVGRVLNLNTLGKHFDFFAPNFTADVIIFQQYFLFLFIFLLILILC